MIKAITIMLIINSVLILIGLEWCKYRNYTENEIMFLGFTSILIGLAQAIVIINVKDKENNNGNM